MVKPPFCVRFLPCGWYAPIGVPSHEFSWDTAIGGKTTSAYVTTTANHGMCWYVTTVDENGNVNPYHVDSNGNAFNAEYE